MLYSTLTDIPGLTFETFGVVEAAATTSAALSDPQNILAIMDKAKEALGLRVEALGGNAVLGLRYDYSNDGRTASARAYGDAVRLIPPGK